VVLQAVLGLGLPVIGVVLDVADALPLILERRVVEALPSALLALGLRGRRTDRDAWLTPLTVIFGCRPCPSVDQDRDPVIVPVIDEADRRPP
jgi:hypothetical protein